jgi:hypothetical protein
MHLKFLDLDRSSLCPIGWPLGKIQLAQPSALTSNAPQPAEFLKLSSQQLKRAAHLKQKIEQLQLELASVCENEVMPAEPKAGQGKSKNARRPR